VNRGNLSRYGQKQVRFVCYTYRLEGQPKQWAGDPFKGGIPIPRQLSIDEICQLLTAMLHTGYPAIGKTAALLGISTRTLQRQLAGSGATYAELVTRCRLREAQQLLADKGKRVQDIARMLGYADPSSFTRAFVRWTHTTPGSFRKQQAAIVAKHL